MQTQLCKKKILNQSAHDLLKESLQKKSRAFVKFYLTRFMVTGLSLLVLKH